MKHPYLAFSREDIELFRDTFLLAAISCKQNVVCEASTFAAQMLTLRLDSTEPNIRPENN